MNLPEDDVGTFEDFIEWLYRRSFDMPTSPPDARYMEPLKLYVLADKYQVTDLKNLITEKMWAMGKDRENPPVLKEVAYAYAHTVQGSGMRKLLADWFAWRIDLTFFESPNFQSFLRQHLDCATDFSVSLAKRLKKLTVKSSFNTKDPFQGDMPEIYKDKDASQAA